MTFAIITLAIVAICGCTQSTGSNDKNGMDIANNTAEIVLQSMNNGKYSDFIYNLNTTLIPLINESGFNTLRNAMNAQCGQYVSKTGPQYSELNGFNVYVYNCTFEKINLKLILAMNIANSSKVEGVRFA